MLINDSACIVYAATSGGVGVLLFQLCTLRDNTENLKLHHFQEKKGDKELFLIISFMLKNNVSVHLDTKIMRPLGNRLNCMFQRLVSIE